MVSGEVNQMMNRQMMNRQMMVLVGLATVLAFQDSKILVPYLSSLNLYLIYIDAMYRFFFSIFDQFCRQVGPWNSLALRRVSSSSPPSFTLVV